MNAEIKQALEYTAEAAKQIQDEINRRINNHPQHKDKDAAGVLCPVCHYIDGLRKALRIILTTNVISNV